MYKYIVYVDVYLYIQYICIYWCKSIETNTLTIDTNELSIRRQKRYHVKTNIRLTWEAPLLIDNMDKAETVIRNKMGLYR